MKRPPGMTLVEVSILLAMVLLVVAISVPALYKNQQQKRAAQCAMHLDAIHAACQKYAAAHGAFPKTLADLVPDYLPEIPACPAAGTYTLGTPEGDPPTCSVPGHHL